MTDDERLLHSFLARAAYILADIRADLLQYPNDSAASGFVCDIDDFFSETYSWLRALERAEKRRESASRSSAPPAATPGDVWKPPPAVPGLQYGMSVTATLTESSLSLEIQSVGLPETSSESPEASSTPPSPSSRRNPGVDFF